MARTKVNFSSPKTLRSSATRGMKATFDDFNLSDHDAWAMSRNMWGDLSPDTVWFGSEVGNFNWETMKAGIDYDDFILNPDPDEFRNDVLDKLAKSYYSSVQKRGDDIIQKVVTSTTVSVLIPVFIDPGLIDIVNRETPFLAIVPARGMRGQTVRVPRRTAGIATEFLADAGGAITIVNHTYADIQTNVRYMYAGFEITKPAIKVTEEQINIKREVTNSTFMDFQRAKETQMLRGVNTAGTESWTGYLTADANAYDGAFKRQHEDFAANETELAGTRAIDIGDIDDSINLILQNGGRADFGVTDLNTAKRMVQIARSYERHSTPETNLGAKQGRFTIDAVDFFATNQLPVGANQKSFLVADKRAYERRTLLADMLEPVGQNLKDTVEAFWKTYETFVVAAPEWTSTVNGGV